MLNSIADTFFFQAEDGIRDHCVTGVQTCALPIYKMIKLRTEEETTLPTSVTNPPRLFQLANQLKPPPDDSRSEERRVGKSVNLGVERRIEKKKREYIE